MADRNDSIPGYAPVETQGNPYGNKAGNTSENTPEIVTDVLRLRKFRAEDAQALYRILGDREVNTFLPMFPLDSVEEAGLFLQKEYLAAYARPAGYHYAVCLKVKDEPIGYINISGDDSHDMGYGLQKELWGQGIMTRACRAVIEQLRRDGLAYITATHDVRNPRSGAVMKKIGMAYRYSYEELWQPKNIPVTFRMYQMNLDGNDARTFRKYWEKYPIHFIEENVD